MKEFRSKRLEAFRAEDQLGYERAIDDFNKFHGALRDDYTLNAAALIGMSEENLKLTRIQAQKQKQVGAKLK
jgi:hypothetical protein